MVRQPEPDHSGAYGVTFISAFGVEQHLPCLEYIIGSLRRRLERQTLDQMVLPPLVRIASIYLTARFCHRVGRITGRPLNPRMSWGYSGVEDRSYAVRTLPAARDLSLDRPRRLSLSATLAASALMTRNVEPLGAEACCSMAKRRCSIALLRWTVDSCVIDFSDCSIRRLPPFLDSIF